LASRSQSSSEEHQQEAERRKRRDKYRVTIFDDLFSIGHLVFGILCGLLGLTAAWILYTVYELVEYVRKRDTIAGDLFEFLVGYAVGAMLRDTLPA